MTVRNEYQFSTLADYDFHWTLCKEGKEVAAGDFRLKTLPQQASKVRIKMPFLKESDEYTLQVYAYTREASDLLPAHYDIAKEQFLHEGKLEEMNRQQAQGNIKVETQKNNIVLTVGDIKAEINKQNGALTNYALDGVSVLHNRTALEPYF